VVVREACAVLVGHGLLEAVFELEAEPVPVFVATTERVEVVDPVAVLDALTDSVPREEEEAVLDTVVLRVVVCVAVTVFVEVLLRVPGSVGLVDLVPVVVRVDVFDCVGVGEGNTLFTTRCLTSAVSCKFPVKLWGGGVVAILPKNARSRSHLILQIHLTISLAPS
jgi:hypothetical protein